MPHAELMDRALKVADDIASLPPLAARLAKESLTKGLDIPNVQDASEVDVYRFMALSQTEDSRERTRPWRERRKAVVRGV